MLIRTWLTGAVVAVALAASLAGTAAGASSHSAAATASFCGVSKKVGVEIANLATSARNASLTKQTTVFKKELGDIKKAAPTLKSHAPKKVKPALNAALGFVNLAYSTLASVHWSIAALFLNPAKAQALNASASTLDTRIAPLKNYYDKVCKFK